jgi:hypothetical protein
LPRPARRRAAEERVQPLPSSGSPLNPAHPAPQHPNLIHHPHTPPIHPAHPSPRLYIDWLAEAAGSSEPPLAPWRAAMYASTGANKREHPDDYRDRWDDAASAAEAAAQLAALEAAAAARARGGGAGTVQAAAAAAAAT